MLTTTARWNLSLWTPLYSEHLCLKSTSYFCFYIKQTYWPPLYCGHFLSGPCLSTLHVFYSFVQLYNAPLIGDQRFRVSKIGKLTEWYMWTFMYNLSYHSKYYFIYWFNSSTLRSVSRSNVPDTFEESVLTMSLAVGATFEVWLRCPVTGGYCELHGPAMFRS